MKRYLYTEFIGKGVLSCSHARSVCPRSLPFLLVALPSPPALPHTKEMLTLRYARPAR